ncbi:CDP-glycerol glycerophosphotransferase family protein [Isoptericola sp. b515]|uniref:CDP-glycerol glycerophosphotransferase family protein n=1 Tax=Isoptericola sp. b515 TaxID=3064652 RepID=UPI0027134ABC|nr:CDP-glycerol glycerophosphotransferase family protein [Isoptericola sp. b515]MDO8149355.1 CDP-glycerol glycerophosphotransferase family protein [Isoptericola sp. b515]
MKELLRVASGLERRKHDRAATAVIRVAEVLQPDDAEVALHRAKRALGRDRLTEAAAILRAALRSNAEDHRLWYRLGFVLERSKDLEESHEAYSRAIELHRSEAEYFYRRAKVGRLLGRDDEAMGDTESALALTESDPRVHQIRFEAASKLPLWRKFEILEQGYALHTRDEKWVRHLADAAFRMKKYDVAARYYDHLLGFPGCGWKDAVHAFVAGTRSGVELTGDTEAIAVRKSGREDARRMGIGVLLSALAFRDLAVATLSRRLATRPTAELYHARGMASLFQYLFDAAAADLMLAAGLAPARAEYHFRLGQALELSGRFAEAADAYRQAMTSDAPTDYRRYRAGYCAWKAGDTSAVVDLLPDVLGLSGESDGEPARRWSPYLERNALAAAGRAMELRDDAMRVRLAGQFASGGDLRRAEELLMSAVRSTPRHQPVTHLKLAQVRALLGDHEGAAAAFVDSRVLRRPFVGDIGSQLKTAAERDAAKFLEFAECLPVDGDLVLLESNHGVSLTCNVLPITRHLLEDPRFEGMTFAVVVNGDGVPQDVLADPRVIPVPRGSELYLRYLATARWLVNNNTFPPYFSRRDEQRYLNTWHGTPLKTLGKHIRGGQLDHKNAARNFLHATHLAAPNDHTARVLLEDYDVAHLYTGKVAVTGSPRVDVTVASAGTAAGAVRERLGLPDDGAPVLFYAPTWRGDLGARDVDTERLRSTLEALVGVGRYRVVFRGHPVDEAALGDLAVPGVTVADPTVPTNEVLTATDVLVTDYSSVIFDFLPLGRPSVFYAYDEAEYRDARGFAVEPAELSRFVFRTEVELVEGLEKIAADAHTDSGWHDAAVETFGATEDGAATRRVVEYFFDDAIEPERVRDFSTDRRESELLFFQGSFMPNGITSSFLALAAGLVDAGVGCTVVLEPSALHSEERRVERFESMDPGVRVIGRVGVQARTAEERWVIDTFNRHDDLPSEAMWDSYWRAFRRESRRMFGSASFDASICFEGYARFWMALLAVTEAGKHGAYLHNDMLGEARTRFPYLYGVARQYRSYDVLASVSESVHEANRAHLPEVVDLDPSRFVSVPNVTDHVKTRVAAEEPVDPELEEWIDPERFTFVNAARLSPEKGHGRLLDALRELRDAGVPVQLLLVGDGPLREVLEAYAGRLGLTAADVRFAGYVANPFPAMRVCDGFVMSSEYEGQGLVVLEALALGLPAMSTDVVGPRTILEGGEGLLVPSTTSGLRDGMRALAEGWQAPQAFDFEAYRRDAVRAFTEAFGTRARDLAEA